MVTLVAKWMAKRGREVEAIAALQELAREVRRTQEGALDYLCHAPDLGRESLPTPAPVEIVFFEVYTDERAFRRHVDGPLFRGFVERHVDLFLTTADASGKQQPFLLVEFLERKAGFIRHVASS
jgi:quinol monooxygenase YgiN